MQVGMIGLGRMGANMARRFMQGGHQCVVRDVTLTAVAALARDGAVATASLDDFAQRLAKPRVVWLMVPAAAVDQALADLASRVCATVGDRSSSMRGRSSGRPADTRVGSHEQAGHLYIFRRQVRVVFDDGRRLFAALQHPADATHGEARVREHGLATHDRGALHEAFLPALELPRLLAQRLDDGTDAQREHLAEFNGVDVERLLHGFEQPPRHTRPNVDRQVDAKELQHTEVD